MILADPPWRFEPSTSRASGMDRAADNHYPTMDARRIKAALELRRPPIACYSVGDAAMLPAAIEAFLGVTGFVLPLATRLAQTRSGPAIGRGESA